MTGRERLRRCQPCLVDDQREYMNPLCVFRYGVLHGVDRSFPDRQHLRLLSLAQQNALWQICR